MESQVHRLAEANAAFASQASEPPARVATVALPNGHGPAEGTLHLPGNRIPGDCTARRSSNVPQSRWCYHRVIDGVVVCGRQEHVAGAEDSG